MSLRNSYARVHYLGSAKSGSRQWWWQRITALALVPLFLWLATALVMHAGTDYERAVAWVAQPWTTLMLIVLIGLTFHHGQLGAQVIIEDYVDHELAKLACLLAVKFASVVMALIGIYSVLRIALGA